MRACVCVCGARVYVYVRVYVYARVFLRIRPSTGVAELAFSSTELGVAELYVHAGGGPHAAPLIIAEKERREDGCHGNMPCHS